MSKTNRTCYCCGREYYYCPSCSSERKDPKIYSMWDSELCRDIFNTLVKESTKKITTLECKKKLIELGVDKNTILKDSVKTHVDRVMEYKEIENTEEQVDEIANLENVLVEDFQSQSEENPENEVVKTTRRTKVRKSSLKNKENSEVD